MLVFRPMITSVHILRPETSQRSRRTMLVLLFGAVDQHPYGTFRTAALKKNFSVTSSPYPSQTYMVCIVPRYISMFTPNCSQIFSASFAIFECRVSSDLLSLLRVTTLRLFCYCFRTVLIFFSVGQLIKQHPLRLFLVRSTYFAPLTGYELNFQLRLPPIQL